MPPLPVLRLDRICKRFGSIVANDAISLELYRGEVLALLGENGAGKTTLMHVLFGHYRPDAGSIEVFGQPLPLGSPRAALQAGIGMVHQHFTLADNLSVLENVMLGTVPLWHPWQNPKPARQRLVDLGAQFGLAVDPAVKVGDLSVGERQRVEILKALYRDVKILILDEPTAVLTPQEVEALFVTLKKLVAAGLSVVFISHKLPEVMAISDRACVLRAGQLVATVATADTTPAQLAQWMIGKPLVQTTRPALPAGAPIVEVQSVTVRDRQGLLHLDSASLTVHRHEIVGIAGVSGNGQTSLFDVISGQRAPTQGHVQWHGLDPGREYPQAIGRIPEDRHQTGLIGEMSLWENLILIDHAQPPLARYGWLNRRLARHHANRLIAAYDVRSPSVNHPARLLSGGNQQKLILSRELSHQPSFILASQPTRGLDWGAVAEVHQRLLEARAAGVGILLISEDLEELLNLSDRIHVIYQGRLSASLSGDGVSVQQLGLLMGEGSPLQVA
jgi:general nucleoside transport system ATP-binding protein